ncbi:MAG: hypothetical protein KAJ91_05170 [Candidatus Aenigmarchaeota archaeon]|nr:hypothetical protein [Candidatus Aenigmarchaeota archaeon]MCK5333697.1 hypothetical protein [Candidatus Aenigmarchaeota archaeon]
MPDYTVEIKPPETMEVIISGSEGQQIKLDSSKFQQITFDYDGDTLIFQGKSVQAVASLRCISDVFWMIMSLTSKGFEFKPNEPLEMLKKIL